MCLGIRQVFGKLEKKKILEKGNYDVSRTVTEKTG
jgi:hypothetical protein